jgi:hypothetical protein
VCPLLDDGVPAFLADLGGREIDSLSAETIAREVAGRKVVGVWFLFVVWPMVIAYACASILEDEICKG